MLTRSLRTPLLTFCCALLIGVSAGAMPTLTNLYTATGVWGNQAPPVYGLRLDGFFGGGTDKEVTFAFDNVLFGEYDNGTARLFGTISVAEYDNTGGPGAFAGQWNIDVLFKGTTGSNAAYRYYYIDNVAGHRELTRIGAEATDYADLITYPTDLSKPFQVGWGANNKNSNFGAAGWVNYAHVTPGNTYGSLDNHYYSSDFLMDLTPVPEPTSMILFGFGLACAAGVRRYRQKQA